MSNTGRVLEQAVSVDGWIGEFDEEGHALVHADIVFRQGDFGEDKDAPVRFKIALKRAEIVIRCPDGSCLRVIKKTMSRASDTNKATIRKQTSRSKKRGLGGNFRVSNKKPDFEASASASTQREESESSELEAEVKAILEQHFTTPDKHPAWEVEPSALHSEYLWGSPWHAEQEPRFKVRKQGNGEDTTMMIEVRCRREDIEVLDLELKDPEEQSRFKRKKNHENNMVAAEQLIKLELEKAGFLDIPDLNEKHSRLLIADTLIFEDE